MKMLMTLMIKMVTAAAGKRILLALANAYVRSTKNTLDDDIMEIITMAVNGDLTKDSIKKSALPKSK